MWAYQVVRDLEAGNYRGSDLMSKEVSLLRNLIHNAHKFHLGSYWRLEEAFKGQLKRSRVFLDNVHEFRLPFGLCWFDYSTTGNPNPIPIPYGGTRILRSAVLAEELLPDLMRLSFFSLYEGEDQWELLPAGAYVSVGRYFGPYEGFMDLVKKRDPVVDEPLLWDRYRNHNVLPVPHTLEVANSNPNEIQQEIRTYCQALEFGVLLLNCKNITTTVEIPKLFKRRHIKNEAVLQSFRYHTLRVVVPGISKPGQLKSGHSGQTRSIHFCRCHIKRFSKVRPLFGRYSGQFWWPAHIRGDKEKGVVIKEYEVVHAGEATKE